MLLRYYTITILLLSLLLLILLLISWLYHHYCKVLHYSRYIFSDILSCVSSQTRSTSLGRSLSKQLLHKRTCCLSAYTCTYGFVRVYMCPAKISRYRCWWTSTVIGAEACIPTSQSHTFYKNGNLEPYLRQKNQQPGDAKECEVRYKAFWRWNMELETSSFVVKLHTHKTETLTLKPPAMCWTPYIYAHTHIVFSHWNIDPETSCYVLKLHTYIVFSHWNIDPETSHAMCWNSIHTQSLLTLKHGPWNFMLCTENAYLKHWAWSLQLYVSYKHEQTAGQTMYTPKLHPAAESLAHTDDASGGLPSEYGPKSQAAFKYPPGTCDKSKI